MPTRPQSVRNLQDQDRQWSRHAARYDELFLDAFHPGVENPLLAAAGRGARPGGGRWPTSAAGPARSCPTWSAGSAGWSRSTSPPA